MDHTDVAQPLAGMTNVPCVNDATNLAPAFREARGITAVGAAASAATVPAAS
jgi:hypothetical protein